MSARTKLLLEGPGGDAPSEVESTFANVLAEVLKLDSVPVESNFFDELGADSLVMAHFCARVRKRGDLPSVSMKDIYRYPTIRSLASALSVVPISARSVVKAPIEAPTPTGAREYFLCGALQIVFYFGYSYLALLAAVEGYEWFLGESEGVESYVRLALFSGAASLVVCVFPIAAKWMLIGRWKPQQFRIWSLAYVRFWVAKTLIWTNPFVYLFVGSPLYSIYLRALGAKIGPRVLILSRRIPVCTDLLTIGEGSVIRREAMFLGYRAEAGRIEIGPVSLGRDVYVGQGSVLEIDTSMGDGAQLAHASSLHRGQSVPAGERWHGSPAQRGDVDYVRVPPARCGKLRRTFHSVITLLGVFLYVPILEGMFELLLGAVEGLVGSVEPSVSAGGALTLRGLFLESVAFSAVIFFGAALVASLAAGIVPRALNVFIKPGEVYPLYGFHYGVFRAIAGVSRMRFLPLLFGDSSYVVHFLTWAGYRLKPVLQTGSNFGSEFETSHPLLTYVGTRTMIADGLKVVNEELSSTSFRVLPAVIGRDNFLGNDVIYPAGGRTGSNCLLANKVMVPLDGEVREGVGLLGSPPFEIPRSVERDSRFDHLRQGEALRRGLAAKNWFNLRTIGIFLGTRWFGLFLVTIIDLAAFKLFYGVLGHTIMAVLLALSAVVAAVYYALVERFFEAVGPPPPPICSIYDYRFWWVERVWKLHPIAFLNLFDGTPFKNLLWRLIGVRIGKRVFDDGTYYSEPTLTSIGDECVLNHRSIIQCESQEDGTFKSGPTALGAGVTVGAGAFVHYGVTMGDGSVLAADSFLMKGENVPARARWGGNPAREM